MMQEAERTYFTLFDTAIGRCGIAWRRDTVLATRLPDAAPSTTARHFRTERTATEGKPPEAVQEVIAAIVGLLNGAQTDLSFVYCDLGSADPFAAAVYAQTRKLAPGQTTTYGRIAAEIGDARAARRVGQALGRNPLPIIVPCHRVLGAGGKLVGFSAYGGTKMKLKMLDIERAEIWDGPGLFADLPLSPPK